MVYTPDKQNGNDPRNKHNADQSASRNTRNQDCADRRPASGNDAATHRLA